MHQTAPEQPHNPLICIGQRGFLFTQSTSSYHRGHVQLPVAVLGGNHTSPLNAVRCFCWFSQWARHAAVASCRRSPVAGAPYAPPPVALWVCLHGGFGQALCAVLFSQRLRRVIGVCTRPPLALACFASIACAVCPSAPPRGLPQNRAETTRMFSCASLNLALRQTPCKKVHPLPQMGDGDRPCLCAEMLSERCSLSFFDQCAGCAQSISTANAHDSAHHPLSTESER